MILSKCAMCGSKKSRFIKNQEAKGLLSKLGIKTPLSKVPIIGDVLLWMQFHQICIKMNQIVKKILLAGNKVMPEIHLKQLEVTYSACGPFTKNKERIHKLKESGDTSYIYKQELNKVCFQDDMAYVDFKDLKRRTASDKSLKDKGLNC